MIENLKKALSEFLKDKTLIEPLAKTLVLFLEEDIVLSDRLKSVAGDDYIDIMLLAFEWRFIIPFSPAKTCAWEDRLLAGINADRYEMPKVVYYVLQEAVTKSIWDVERGLIRLFSDTDLPLTPEGMLTLSKEIFKRAKFMCVTGKDIALSCRRFRHPGLADHTIAIFKSLGIISPKLGSAGPLSPKSGPLYEVNPSLLQLFT